MATRNKFRLIIAEIRSAQNFCNYIIPIERSLIGLINLTWRRFFKKSAFNKF